MKVYLVFVLALASIFGIANAERGDTNSDLCFKIKDSKSFLNVNPAIVPQPTPPSNEQVQQVEQNVLKFYEENCNKISKTHPIEKFFSEAFMNCYDKCGEIIKPGPKQVVKDFCEHQCSAYNWQASALIQGIKEGAKSCEGSSSHAPNKSSKENSNKGKN